MEATLLPFVFHVDLTRPLMVEQHLSEHQFEVVLVHVIARARYLIIMHIGEVEGRAEAVAGLGDGVDVSASLERTDVFLCAEDRGDAEPIVRQAVALQDIRPFGSDSIQFASRSRYQIGHRMGQAIDDIVLGGMYEPQVLLHTGGIRTVFGRTGQTYLRRHGILAGLEVIELGFVVKRPAGILDHMVFHDLLFGAIVAPAGAFDAADGYQHHNNKNSEYRYSVRSVFLYQLSELL